MCFNSERLCILNEDSHGSRRLYVEFIQGFAGLGGWGATQQTNECWMGRSTSSCTFWVKTITTGAVGGSRLLVLSCWTCWVVSHIPHPQWKQIKPLWNGHKRTNSLYTDRFILGYWWRLGFWTWVVSVWYSFLGRRFCFCHFFAAGCLSEFCYWVEKWVQLSDLRKYVLYCYFFKISFQRRK